MSEEVYEVACVLCPVPRIEVKRVGGKIGASGATLASGPLRKDMHANVHLVHPNKHRGVLHCWRSICSGSDDMSALRHGEVNIGSTPSSVEAQ